MLQTILFIESYYRQLSADIIMKTHGINFCFIGDEVLKAGSIKQAFVL